jgi:hypothetical protein
MNSERFDALLSRRLREAVGRPVPPALDHRVRTALRTLPIPGIRPFARATMALGLAASATFASMIGLAMSFASAGAGETGIALAVAVVVAYLGTASVVLLPLLLRLKFLPYKPEAEA